MKSLLDKTNELQDANAQLQKQIGENNDALAIYQVLMFSDLLTHAAPFTSSVSFELILEYADIKKNIHQDYFRIGRIFPPEELPEPYPDFFKEEHLQNMSEFLSTHFYSTKSNRPARKTLPAAFSLIRNIDHLQRKGLGMKDFVMMAKTDPASIAKFEEELCSWLRIQPEKLEQVKISCARERLNQALPDTNVSAKKIML